MTKKSSWLSVVLLMAVLTVVRTGWSGGLPWDSQIGAGTGSFLLMSDIHLDPFANPGLVKKLIAAPVEQWEGIFESSPNDPFAAYGKDTNYPLMVSALSEAQREGPYDFAIITGDYLVHESRALFEPIGGKDEQAYEDFVTKTEIFLAREVQKRLAGTPIYFSLGNNDSECGDYMMATHTSFLAALTGEWQTLKGFPDAQKTMAEAGYYAVPHPTLPNTGFIVLNDIYWSNHYSEDACHSEPNEHAGDDEMAWLKSQLASAKAKNEKVILVMHIPPQGDIYGIYKSLTDKQKGDKGAKKKGDSASKKKDSKLFWDDQYEAEFVQLAKEYSDTIEFSFAGHTHMDDFRILNDDQGSSVLVTHICPAVSPIRGNNPGFQVMEYDKNTGAIQDMATFYLENLASAKGDQGGHWDLEYDFDTAYGVSGYNASSLKALSDSIDQGGDGLLKFAQYYVVSAPEIIPPDAWKKLNDVRYLWNEKQLNAAVKKAKSEP